MAYFRIFELFLAIYKIDIGQLTYIEMCEYAEEKGFKLSKTEFFIGIAQNSYWELENFIEDVIYYQFNKK